MLGKHLIGIYEKALNPDDSWNERFNKVKQLGFDFMELSIDEQDSRIDRLYWPDKKIIEFRRMAEDSNISIQSMCLSAHRRFSFGSINEPSRIKAFDIMKRAIHFSAIAGIRVIQLAGYDVFYEPSTSESRERFLGAMLWSAREAAQNQIMLALEIMDTVFINSITKYLSYRDYVNSPWFKVYPDLGNLSAWDLDVASELRKGIGDIVGVHVKDTKKVTGNFSGQFKCVPFGKGCVDFLECFLTLEESGYTGPYLIEMWFDPDLEDLNSIKKAKLFVEAQFQTAIKNIGNH